ncbi:MAG: DUF4129 domain-containing protein [Chitinophagales bacterium]
MICFFMMMYMLNIPNIAAAQELDSCFVKNDYVIEKRSFDAEKMESYTKQRAFNYNKLPPKPNPLEQFLYWLSQKLDSIFGSKTSSNVWFYLKYILLLIALYIVLKTFLKVDINGLFFKQSQKNSRHLKHSELVENIHEIDFEKMIEAAVSKKMYRLAVRLYYLKTLKKLTDSDLIHWQINKTNLDYIREMQTKPLHKDFRQLTHWFDYVWYGNFELTTEDFEDIQARFLTFEQEI